MKEKPPKMSGKTVESSLKKAINALLLAAGLLVSSPSAAKSSAPRKQGGDIEQRVKSVRAALQKKLADSQDNGNKLSYSEMEMTQWGNWGNWNNWNNWRNWGNWNNWNNWGNWRNY